MSPIRFNIDPTLHQGIEQAIKQITSELPINVPEINKRNRRAIEQLCILMQDKVAHKIGYIIRDPEVVKDLKQDLLAKLLTNFVSSKRQFSSAKEVENYVLKSAVNISLDYIKKRGKERAALKELMNQPVAVSEQPDTVRQFVYFDWLKHLPEPDRTVLALMLQGYNNTEIAAITGISTKTVGKIKKRIIDYLQKHLPGEPN